MKVIEGVLWYSGIQWWVSKKKGDYKGGHGSQDLLKEFEDKQVRITVEAGGKRIMEMLKTAPLVSITGNVPVGDCCGCTTYNSHGLIITPKKHYTLWQCQNPNCDHLCCDLHRQPCGYCEGCCAELHGLGSHIEEVKDG